MNNLKVKIGMFLLFSLTGCGTFNLGYVKPQAGKTSDQQMLDTLTCKDQARLSTETAGKQVGDFLLGMTIIGAPMAYELDKKNKREFFKNCMNAKGYEVIPADDDSTAQATFNSTSSTPTTSSVKIVLSDGWSEQPIPARMKSENVRFLALNSAKDVGVAISVFNRKEIGDVRQRLMSRRTTQMNNLDTPSATEIININSNGFQGLQTEVTGNLRTGTKQRITYLQNVIEGADEVVFITFWGLAESHERNKAEFVKYLATLSGITRVTSDTNSVSSKTPGSPASQSINMSLPSNPTEGARKLVELKSLLDSGVINAQDYEIKKQQILKSM